MASVSNPESASVEYRQAQGMSRTNKLKCPLMPPASATSLKPDQLTDSLLGMIWMNRNFYLVVFLVGLAN